MARDVNFCWNWANEAQKHALKWNKKWPSYFDLSYLVAGASDFFTIPADTINQTCKQYVKSRRQHKKPFLRWRGKKSLGWVPFRADQLRIADGGFRFFRNTYGVWLSRPLPEGKIVDGGSFSQDSRGRWYINIPVEVPIMPAANNAAVGIDLGLKDLAVLSNGERIEAPRLYRRSEDRLATAQRARKKKRVTRIHAKIKARRRDFLHKASASIASRFGMVAVGNVNAAKLAKTRMAKSVLDAGWSDFRSQLAYKLRLRGGRYFEVDEANTTRTCCVCGCITGPEGRKGLSVRQWECVECGAVHDRDVNSAILIARRAHPTPIEGAVA
jgi:IS605 OrfB family transposase